MKKLFVIFSTLLSFIVIKAQSPSMVSMVWEKTFFSGVWDQPAGMSLDNHEDLVVNGLFQKDINNKAIINKFRLDGNHLWDVKDTTNYTISIQNQIAVLKNNNIYLAMYTRGLNTKYFISCFDSLGNKIWQKEMPSNVYLVGYGDTLIAVGSGSDKNIYFLDTGGNTISQFPHTYYLSQICPKIYGEFLYISGSGQNGAQVEKISLNTKELVWEKKISGLENISSAIDKNGNLLVAGSKVVSDSVGFLARYVSMLDSNGKVLWERQWFSRETYETNYENWTKTIDVSTENNLVVVGGSIQKGNSHTWDRSCYLKGLALSNGKDAWEIIWDYPEASIISQVTSVLFDKNNDLLVLGNSSSNGNPVNTSHLAKYKVSKVLGVENPKLNSPSEFRLEQNYPNPFNPNTTIRYSVSNRQHVKLTVYDLLGREIEVLVSEEQEAGGYEVNFKATGLPSGTYLYRLQTADRVETRKMVLLK